MRSAYHPEKERIFGLSEFDVPCLNVLSSVGSERSDLGISNSQPFNIDTLQYDQQIMRSEGQLGYWFETAPGRREFENLFEGVLETIARSRAAETAAILLDICPDLIIDKDQQNAIVQGLWRLIRIGWGIAVTSHLGKDWIPESNRIDKYALVNSTAQTMMSFSESSLTAVEWYGFVSRKEKAVDRHVLLPLRTPVGEVGIILSNYSAELMASGQWCLKYGIALGRCQIKMQ